MGSPACGSWTTIGLRERQEDRFVAGRKMANGHHVYGVFDGHGGDSVSTRLETDLVAHLDEAVSRRVSDTQALETALTMIDDSLVDAASVGSTATVVVLGDDEITCANCGDSRAVLMRAGGLAVELSRDHSLNREDEHDRIRGVGGIITGSHGMYRVVGMLNMSRSIGDKDLRCMGVIPVPEFVTARRTPEDRYVIIASDGLWDVVTSQGAADLLSKIVERCIEKGCKAFAIPHIAAKVLGAHALRCGTRDNVTVLVVDVGGGLGPSLHTPI